MSKKATPEAKKTLLLTRSQDASESWIAALETAGFRVIHEPAVRVLRSARASRKIFHAGNFPYDWVVFTSPNGVRFFGKPVPEAKVAAIGPATALAARERGWTVAAVAAESKGEGLAARLRKLRNQSILLFRAEKARNALPESLRKGGNRVDIVAGYRTLPRRTGWRLLAPRLRRGAFRAVLFFSGSAVDSFFGYYGARLAREILSRNAPVAIGPITQAALRTRGIRAWKAKTPSTRAMLAVLREVKG